MSNPKMEEVILDYLKHIGYSGTAQLKQDLERNKAGSDNSNESKLDVYLFLFSHFTLPLFITFSLLLV